MIFVLNITVELFLWFGMLFSDRRNGSKSGQLCGAAGCDVWLYAGPNAAYY